MMDVERSKEFTREIKEPTNQRMSTPSDYSNVFFVTGSSFIKAKSSD